MSSLLFGSVNLCTSLLRTSGICRLKDFDARGLSLPEAVVRPSAWRALSIVWDSDRPTLCGVLNDHCEESSMQDFPYDTSHVPIDYDDSVNVKEVRRKVSRTDERRERSDQRAALEKDVLQLQRQLIIEMNVRNALSRGISRPLGSLPRIYADLPLETRNLLLEVAVLEEEIVSLEKQVTHLGREIEIEGVPASDKETIWESTAEYPSPKKVAIVVSPLVSPRNSARINSKVTMSSRKSSDQKKNPSKPSFSKVLENKRSFIKVSVSAPRSSLDNGSSIKPSKSPRDSSELRDVFSLAPLQKPQVQRISSFPKATPSKIRELKSRRLSVLQKEPLEPSGVMHTVPFIPIKCSPPKEDEESYPPQSPALVVVPEKGYSQPSKIKTGNRGNTPVIANSRFGRKDLTNSKLTPKTRTVKARGTSSSAGPNKGSPPPARILRLPLASDTILTSRTMSASTATSKQRMTKEDGITSNTSTPQIKCDLCLQKPVDAEPDNNPKNNLDIPSTVSGTAGYRKPNNLFPDLAKPPLAAGSGSSSQASISTKLSSASPGKRGSARINFRPDDHYIGSFMMMRSASTKYMRDCYSGEVAEALRDPTIYLNKENMSSGTGFHQGLMS